jgi:hypothetical protein
MDLLVSYFHDLVYIKTEMDLLIGVYSIASVLGVLGIFVFI